VGVVSPSSSLLAFALYTVSSDDESCALQVAALCWQQSLDVRSQLELVSPPGCDRANAEIVTRHVLV